MKKIKIYILGLFMLYGGIASAQFITTWKTDNNGSSSDDQITIPTLGGGYDYKVDWGDGMNDTGVNGNITHTYAIAGTYTVTITEDFPRIYFNNGGDKDKILTIEQWGTNPWTTMASAFSGCSFLTIATGAGAPNLSSVTNLTEMFRNTDLFNSDLSSWDVSNIITMRRMFRFAEAFNGNISGWDVRAVLDMSEMFIFAENFNQDIGAWEVGNVTNMGFMFFAAFAFDQDISFKPGGGNNGDDAWNTANVTNMRSMFESALDFNQNIGGWDVSSVTNISSMFNDASAFNQNISSWNLSGVTSWSNLFRYATVFNQDLSAWNVYSSSITDMSSMFQGATAFNQDISSWDVSNVSDFNGMFENNTAFNQDISGWIVSSAIGMQRMFNGASSFNQNLGGWEVSNVTNFIDMLNNSGLSVDNFDNLLIGWEGLTLSMNENLGAFALNYCNGESARASIITSFNWTINDAGQNCILVFEGSDTTGPEIVNGQANPFDFGSINTGANKTYSFTIQNRTSSVITNFNVVPSLGSMVFSVTSPAFPVTITSGNSLTIVVQLNSPTSGAFNETLSITSDSFTNPFEFNLIGEVTAITQPEIKIFDNNTTTGNIILDGDVSGLIIGSTLRGTDAIRQITIENKGSAVLNITGVSVTGGAFSLNNPSVPFTIPIDGTLVLTITLDGTVSGNFAETLMIESNDSDENPYDFLITGDIFGPAIAVFDGPNRFSFPTIPNGMGYTIDFMSATVGTDITRQITIINSGMVDLTVSDISVAAPFTVVPPTPYPFIIPAIEDGSPGVRVVEITLSGMAQGSFNEPIAIINNDDDDSSFSFNLTGEITAPEPKVYWTEESGNEINRANFDGTSFEQYHAEPTYNPRGIAINTLNKIVYWTNNWGQIRKGEIDPTGLVNVNNFMNDGIDTNREMGGIALDVTGDNMYWVSTYDGKIKTASLLETDPANVTITELVLGLSNPIGIAIDTTANLIYYTENVIDALTGDNIASLHQVNIDGTNDVVLVTETIAGQQYTYNDVVINATANTIYWTASNGDIFNAAGDIFQANLANVSGSKNTIPSISPNLPYGLAIDVNIGKIYWTDMAGNMNSPPAAVNSANLDGSGKIVLQSDLPNLSSPLFISLDISQPAAGCQAPPTADAGADQFVCSTDIVNLVGIIGGGASFSTWSTSGDGSFGNINLPNTTYTLGFNDRNTGSVILTFTASAVNCTDVNDQMIVTISQPISIIDQSATINVNETSTIDVFNGSFINNDDVTTTILLSQPQKGTAIINNDGTITYTALEGNVGTDTFDFQVENQCNQTANATATITIPNTTPEFNDGNATTIPGVPVTINIIDLITDLNGNIDLSSIQIIQQPGSGAPATLDADNNLVVDYTGMIFFGVDEVVIEVCDFDGACTEASIFITVEALPIEAYNAVSPNGDGRHDFLEFRYIEAYPTNNVKIFNRWGDIVFEIEGYNNQDKIFTGLASVGGAKELPTGTYYYTVVLKLPTDKFETVKGYFELRR